jgi:mRNA interferase RelE/StbE
MMWRIVFTDKAAKQSRKLDQEVNRRIKEYLTQVAASGVPRKKGKALTGDLGGYWRYRIGDYRVIVDIKDDKLLILAVGIGHRRNVYER